MQSLILERSDLEALLQEVGVDGLMDRLIAQLRKAILEWDEQTTRIQPRDGFAYEDPVYGLQEWMPICKVGDATLMKMVGYHPNNPTRHGIPTVLSTLSAYDTASGHLRAVVDGTLLTAMRTGAASALASEVLARPDSRTVGLIGCGAQAVTQVHALSRLFALEKVWGYDVNPEAAASLPARLEWLDLSVERVGFDDLKDRLPHTDILCTCTSEEPGKGPVLPDLPTAPHLHINAVGSDFPGKMELPLLLLQRALVVPDYPDQARKEGECQQLDEMDIGPDLTALLRDTDDAKPLRDSLTVFDSTGWALEDLVAFNEVVAIATELGLGRTLDIECRGDDPLNPYSLNAALASLAKTHGL